MSDSTSRRSFLQAVGVGATVVGLKGSASAQQKTIQGFEEAQTDPNASKGWKPVSDRKIRVGIVGQYLARVYDELKRRPVYLVADELGFDSRS